MNDLKLFIQQHLLKQYKCNIGIHPIKIQKKWFYENNHDEIYDDIITTTHFLNNKSSISERVFCIYNNINTLPLCIICNKKSSFPSYTVGYRLTCGNKKCHEKAKNEYKDKNGETANDRTVRKSKKIFENNPNIRKMAGIKMSATRHNDGSFKKGAIKGAKTKMETIEENGLSVAQNASLKAANTMKQTIMNDGKSLKQHRLDKGTLTKQSKIINGLDGFERAFLNGAGRNSSIKYYNTELYYHGTYEKHFLDLMSELVNIKNIKRGPRVYYIDVDGIKRQYRADFKIGKYVYEIKSCWTYDHSKKDKKRRINNKRKMKALKTAGYIPIIVYNKEIWYTYKDVIIAKWLK